MSINIPIQAITLEYVCDQLNCTGTGEQPLVDIVEVGTLICPNCGEDMILVNASIAGEPRRTVTIDEKETEALSPKADQPGVLVVDAVALGFGTHAAVFRPVERRFNTPTLDFHRGQSGVEFVPSE